MLSGFFYSRDRNLSELLVISNGSIFATRFSNTLDNLGLSHYVRDFFWRADRAINKYKDVEGLHPFVDRFDLGGFIIFHENQLAIFLHGMKFFVEFLRFREKGWEFNINLSQVLISPIHHPSSIRSWFYQVQIKIFLFVRTQRETEQEVKW